MHTTPIRVKIREIYICLESDYYIFIDKTGNKPHLFLIRMDLCNTEHCTTVDGTGTVHKKENIMECLEKHPLSSGQTDLSD